MALQVAVVGIGDIGSIHAGIYVENPKSELVAVCDTGREKADRKAKQYGCKAFYSVKRWLTANEKLSSRLSRLAGKRSPRRRPRPQIAVAWRRGLAAAERDPLSRAVPSRFALLVCLSGRIGAHLSQPAGQVDVGGSQFIRVGSKPGGARPVFTR